MGVAVGPPVVDRPAVRPAKARAEVVSRPATASLTHRADIQGLRAVAVLLVVVTHAGVRFVPAGYVGVDVFFVLSGFLITGMRVASLTNITESNAWESSPRWGTAPLLP